MHWHITPCQNFLRAKQSIEALALKKATFGCALSFCFATASIFTEISTPDIFWCGWSFTSNCASVPVPQATSKMVSEPFTCAHCLRKPSVDAIYTCQRHIILLCYVVILCSDSMFLSHRSFYASDIDTSYVLSGRNDTAGDSSSSITRGLAEVVGILVENHGFTDHTIFALF